MIFNLGNKKDLMAFQSRIVFLKEKQVFVELTEKRVKKTINQNKYVHVILGLIGLEYGLTLDEAKQLMKTNYGIEYEKKGKTFQKSFANYTKLEMSDFIDKTIRKFAELGFYIPPPEESDMIHQAQNEIEKANKFLNY